MKFEAHTLELEEAVAKLQVHRLFPHRTLSHISRFAQKRSHGYLEVSTSHPIHDHNTSSCCKKLGHNLISLTQDGS